MNSFKSSDKVWIYTSPQELDDTKKELILSKAKEFLNSWESHGDKVKGEIGVAYDRFVIIVADDCGGSMCGRAQDAQIRFVKEVGEEINIDLTDRMQLAYRAGDDMIQVKPMVEFKKAIQEGVIDEATIVFNNMITTYEELDRSWEVPLRDSWHKQLMG